MLKMYLVCRQFYKTKGKGAKRIHSRPVFSCTHKDYFRADTQDTHSNGSYLKQKGWAGNRVEDISFKPSQTSCNFTFCDCFIYLLKGE